MLLLNCKVSLMHQTTDGQKIEVEMIEYLGHYLVDPDKM